MAKERPTLLIVDDEKHTREGLKIALESKYHVSLARHAQEAIDGFEAQRFDLVLTDLRMAGESGLSVLDAALKQPNQPICILMTAYGDVENAVEAMKRGAKDFLIKPLNLSNLEIVLERALKNKQLETENTILHKRLQQAYSWPGMIGQSAIFQQTVNQIRQIAPTLVPVLLEGQSGTGKSLAAQIIHQNSPYAHGPFIQAHCQAIPEDLMEIELLGCVKGSCPSPMQERHAGYLEQADQGTLCLNEIEALSLTAQLKLLSYLEHGEFQRVGSPKPMRTQVRIIATTSQDLIKKIKDGAFREDLFYQLNIATIHLPSLKERKSDIILLIEHYLKSFSHDNHQPKPKLTQPVIEFLEAYPWPGNIRQLRNLAEHLVALYPGQLVGLKQLPAWLNEIELHHFTEDTDLALKGEGEKIKIYQALKQSGGNRTQAAQLLGISRRTLHRRLQQWAKPQ